MGRLARSALGQVVRAEEEPRLHRVVRVELEDREEADRLEVRLWGNAGTKSRYQDADSASADEAQEAENPIV